MRPPYTPDLPGYPAAFSPDRRYRYVLWRNWTDAPSPRYLMVVGLNPSIADERVDDPTLKRCVGFARDWGYDALCMTNLFAFRATDPALMKSSPLPIGYGNESWLRRCGEGAAMILAGWGRHGTHMDREAEVLRWFRGWGYPLHALGFTQNRQPRHPLYMKADSRPFLLL